MNSDFRTDLNQRKAERQIMQGLAMNQLRKYPLLYIGLLVSGFLSSMAGVFIGIAPKFVNGILTYNADFLAIFFAIVYAITFPALGEYAIFQWHLKYSFRDMDEVEDDKRQGVIAIVMLVISIVFTLVTSIAAAVILASLLGSFDVFKSIPTWAQRWTVIIIPIGAVIHAVATILYRHGSREEENARMLQREFQDAESNARSQVQAARNEAKVAFIKAQTERYVEMALQQAPIAGRKMAEKQVRKEFGHMQPATATNQEVRDHTRAPLSTSEPELEKSNGNRK